ncbi:MAG: M23 family metallopeptidase [Ruminococcaceae bacterium]|nr:M23 family metallopeptidase [Oscillospiraceae bacterium]
MKITYTNTPVNKQKRNYPSFKALGAMLCVIALMAAVRVIYSPEESMEDVAAMANATIDTEKKEEKESLEAVQTGVLHLSPRLCGADASEKAIFFPLQGEISSGFEERNDPFGTSKTEFHYGIDIVPEENKNIIAYTDGRVEMAEYDRSYGNFIKLSHENGTESIYAHCSALKVRIGEKVRAGQIIATVGSTGDSTGEHLHFEIRENGEKVDPMEYFT